MSIATIVCLVVSTVLAQADTTPPDASAPQEMVGAPYLLDVCAVSGEKIPQDGGTVLVMSGTDEPEQAGREIRFCCSRCKTAFEETPGKYVPKIDELIIADQLPRYPASVPCLVMRDEMLPDPRGPEAAECEMLVWNNRLIRLCCKRCVRMFRAEPAKYIATLDTAVIQQAKKANAVRNCVVNGRPLTARANWFVVGDRAAATCCRGCQPKAMAAPRKTVAKLDSTT